AKHGNAPARVRLNLPFVSSRGLDEATIAGALEGLSPDVSRASSPVPASFGGAGIAPPISPVPASFGGVGAAPISPIFAPSSSPPNLSRVPPPPPKVGVNGSGGTTLPAPSP